MSTNANARGERERHPLSDLFPAMAPAEYALLKRDIAEKGILQPILLAPDGSILDGRHRYQAGLELGLEDGDFAFQQLPEGTGDRELVAQALSLNLHRRHLSQSQLAMVAARARPLFEDVLGDKATIAAVNEAAAKALQVGQQLVASAVKLQEKSNATQALLDAVDSGKAALDDSLAVANQADDVQADALERIGDGRAKTLRKALQQIRRQKQIEQIRKAPPVEGKYAVLVVDPPWRYDKRPEDVTQRGQTPYPTMSPEELMALKLPAADDCILWLWATNAHMPLAFQLLEHWGFTSKTILTWVKPRIGVGDWLRGQTEHCILAIKGHPVARPPGATSTVLAAPTGKHSEKPDAFYQIVEQLCSGSKAELFSRKEREGWRCFGGELP
jgi:N6-adenosine-specific RNA methylase IME4